jgi:hypothetical protein
VRVQGIAGLRHLELLARALAEMKCPLLKHSESVVANIRATLEDQVVSRDQDRALLEKEVGLPGHP